MDINPKAKKNKYENAYRPADGGLGHHTTLIEFYDSANRTLYTIEGNTGGRVAGYVYDLTKVADVRLIIGVARPGLDSGTAQPTPEDERQQPISPGTLVTESELLNPVREVNEKLQNLGEQMGIVHEAVEGYDAKVAQLEGPNARSRSGDVDDN